MRKHYIDNLRILCILLLFPYHTAMIYNTFGERFYITGTPTQSLTFGTLAVYPWWMTGLFVLAGMSTMYALEHRTGKEYVKERIRKLLIPLLSCLVFVVPMQTYIADMFHNGYQGSYLSHFKTFLSITDLGGYDGHFTPGHLWFVLYLFVISLVTLPILLWYQRGGRKLEGRHFSFPVIFVVGVPMVCLSDVLNIGGKSLAQFGVCFLIGYFIMSNENVLECLQKNSIILGIAWVLLMIIRCIFYDRGLDSYFVSDVFYCLLEWIGILAMLGLGRRFLNHNWRFTRCMVKAEFPLYLFHQTILIMVGYWIMPYVKSVYAQFILIVVISFVLSYLLYLVCRRFRVTRFLFAIKSPLQ